MKRIMFVLVALSAIFFSSCATTKIFGGEKVPEWVITEPESDSNGIYASGSGRHSDFDMAYKMAKADAMNNLAKKINLKVTDTVQTSILSSGSSSRKYEENATQLAEAVLKKADVKDYFEKKDGTVYVLMYMEIKDN